LEGVLVYMILVFFNSLSKEKKGVDLTLRKRCVIVGFTLA